MSSVCAVVITYYPDTGFPKRVERMARQVACVVIVDNSSPEASRARLRRAASRDPRVHLLLNPENVGLATALNQGIEYAAQGGFEWVLMLDQDSVPADGMVEEMIAVYNTFAEKEKIGIIAAHPVDRTTGLTPYAQACMGRRWCEQKVAITSGSLMPLEPYRKIGRFRDDFFIDGVDQEYCLRLRRNGYQVVLACHARIEHSLGRPSVHRLWGRRVIPTNHAPVRRYYIARNSVAIAREYLFREPKWVARHLFALLRSTILVVLCEDAKRRKLRSTALGLWHGIIGRMGPRDGNGKMPSEKARC